MKDQRFTHLHVHTDASLRDGLGTVSGLVQHAKSLGFNALAMTDHGTLANAVTFSIEAQSAGIKPIMGMEGYVAFDGEIGHITLLADGPEGWASLVDLNNVAQIGPYKSPAFSIDQLAVRSRGLICLTGCVASPFHQLSLEEAYRLGLKLKSVFGSRLFAEVMFVGGGTTWERSMRLSSRLRIKPVITNDVHFPREDDGAIHPILTKMKSGFDYDSSHLFLKTEGQLWAAARGAGLRDEQIMDMLGRAYNIGRLIKPVELKAEPSLPRDAFSDVTLEDVLRGSSRFVSSMPLEYEARVRHELAIIEEMGYGDYFLILDDLIQYAKRKNVKVGPGRGSGAGSLVLYLLGITDVDPIMYGLQFERFLNPERRGMPDVDVDLDSEGRELVLEYAADKYGAVPIATYSRYSHRSLVRDLSKMFRVDQDLMERAADLGPNSKAFKELVKLHPGFDHAYERFLGQIRHKGKHAGGVIITDTVVPLERVSDTVAAGWTEGGRNELSYAGVVKFDLLGLTALTALRRLESMVGDKPAAPGLDPIVFKEIFQTGDLSGVFQFSGSEGIRELTIDVAPSKFADLIAINALYRPGALDAGSTELYSEWMKSPRDVPEYIKDVLAETYGAIVYQEQMMEIYRRTVDGTMAEADQARRVITKSKPDDPRWVEKFKATKDRFINSAIDRGLLTPAQAMETWRELETHTRYSFNKSHSTAYAMIAWECAWWKCHYPVEFYSVMLSVDQQEQQTYVMDAVRNGIQILPPHVNKASEEWVPDSEANKIYMPIGSVKFLGPTGVQALVNDRKTHGPYESLEQFMKRVPKRLVRARARRGLLQLGGFAGLTGELTYGEACKVLEIEPGEEFKLRTRRQLEFLGYLIPDAALLAEFEAYEHDGYTCGIIKETDSRHSKWGPYTVYRLAPHGVFWSREVADLEVGQPLAVKISDKNGKAKEIKLL